MTELVNRPVDNGERLLVVCPFFEGLAGVRRGEAGGEFACTCRIVFPRDRFGAGANRASAILAAAIGTGRGTVDGEPIVITDLRVSGSSSAILVAKFEYVREE